MGLIIYLLVSPSSPFIGTLKNGLRKNLVPGLFLQLFALALVLTYYRLPQAKPIFSALGQLKAEYGYLFAAISTVFFGALIPFGILVMSGRIKSGKRRAELLFLVMFWLWRGIEVDAFYRFQAELFGDEARAAVVLKKMLFDQFVYNVVWVVPVQTFLFDLKNDGMSWKRWKSRFLMTAFFKRCIVVLFSTWLVWIPAVTVVYSLPQLLQLPLCNLVLCFWCLLLSFVSSTPEDDGAESGTANC